MQETTFNSPYQTGSTASFLSVHLWLDALYSQASQKKFDFLELSSCESLKKLQNNLNYHFRDPKILINALTHSTFSYESEESKGSDTLLFSNERMEFVGDSLVNFLTAKILFKRFPHLQEGDLSKLRGALVNEHSLSLLAQTISLGENLILGKGEFKNKGFLKESILADALEALFAAIYFDSDEDSSELEKIFLVIIKKFETEVQGREFFALENLEQFDSKTKLQEFSVALFQKLPTYTATEEKNGFRVQLWIGERMLAETIGPSKKKCEKELARIALDEKRYL